MKINYLLGAVAVSALMTGAAYAQTGSSTQPGTNATTDQSMPSTSNGTMSNDTSVSGSASSSMPSASTSTDTSSSGVTATSATTYGQGASVTTTMTTNGPIPDTPENRAKYGQPMSHAGRKTAPRGN